MLLRPLIGLVVSRGYTRTISHHVDGDEVAIRAIVSPYHLNGKRTGLSRKAFTAPAGTDEVSVSRQPHVAPTLAKMWAKLIVQAPPEKVYVGLAFVEVNRVRQAKSEPPRNSWRLFGLSQAATAAV